MVEYKKYFEDKLKHYQNHMFALLKVPNKFPDDYTTFRTNSYGVLSVEMYFFSCENMLSIKISALITAKGRTTNIDDKSLILHSENPSTCYIDYADLNSANVGDIFNYYLNKKNKPNGQRLININTKDNISVGDFIKSTSLELEKYLNNSFLKLKLLNKRNNKKIAPKFDNSINSRLVSTFRRSFNKAIKFTKNEHQDKYRFQFGDGALRVVNEVVRENSNLLLVSKLKNELDMKEEKKNIVKV